MRKQMATLLFLAGLSVGAFAQAKQTLTGTISDSMCGAKHGMAGKSPAECARACVKGGGDYVLVDGGKIYTLKGKSEELDKMAGGMATVTGTVNGTTVEVATVSPAR